MNKKEINEFANIFDDTHNLALQNFSSKTDLVREMIDRSVSKILKIDYKIMCDIRDELINEPMLTGRRYQDSSLDSRI